MIFKKEVNFPYPVLSQYTTDYPDSSFELDVNVFDLGKSYKFTIDYRLNSSFISSLLSIKKASIVAIFESIDSSYYQCCDELIIPKNRISLSKKTQIQLFIKTNSRISLANNNELDKFYDAHLSKVFIDKDRVLAISNVVRFDGDLKHPFKLFEKEYDKTMETDISVELTSEMIRLKYRNKDFVFPQNKRYNPLNNSYFYLGLQKALIRFLVTYRDEDDDSVNILNIDDPSDGLDLKLYNLMKIKGVETYNLESVDKVIHSISDRIVEKQIITMRGFIENEG